jgi:hypothetical protein
MRTYHVNVEEFHSIGIVVLVDDTLIFLVDVGGAQVLTDSSPVVVG